MKKYEVCLEISGTAAMWTRSIFYHVLDLSSTEGIKSQRISRSYSYLPTAGEAGRLQPVLNFLTAVVAGMTVFLTWVIPGA